MKDNYNEEIDNDIIFRANSIRYFDPEYKETHQYNGYNAKEHAEKDFYEIMKNHPESAKKCNIMTFDDKVKVKEKQISKEKKSSAAKKTIIAILVAAGVLAGSVQFMDFANHPESYMTTHPDFEGAPSISEVLERTPDNFGIGR